jgi:hypothetical protein
MKSEQKKWLDLFYGHFEFTPTSLLRKKREYVGKASIYDLFEIANESEKTFLIHFIFPNETLFPIKRPAVDCVVILPQIIFFKKSFFEVETPIFWKGTFYSVDDFIRNSHVKLSTDINTHSLTNNFFNFDTDEFSDFKKRYLTPFKDKLRKSQVHFEQRGKSPKVLDGETRDLIKERKGFILQKAKAWKHRFRTSNKLVYALWVTLTEEGERRFPNKETDSKERKCFKRFVCKESEIGNIIRPIAKSLVKSKF